jgi:hypothetical protein
VSFSCAARRVVKEGKATRTDILVGINDAWELYSASKFGDWKKQFQRFGAHAALADVFVLAFQEVVVGKV